MLGDVGCVCREARSVLGNTDGCRYCCCCVDVAAAVVFPVLLLFPPFQTHAFVASPEMVVATAIAGSVTFNPDTDSIPTPDGKSFKFEAPFGKELPPKGFDAGEDTFQVGVHVLCVVNGRWLLIWFGDSVVF